MTPVENSAGEYFERLIELTSNLNMVLESVKLRGAFNSTSDLSKVPFQEGKEITCQTMIDLSVSEFLIAIDEGIVNNFLTGSLIQQHRLTGGSRE